MGRLDQVLDAKHETKVLFSCLPPIKSVYYIDGKLTASIYYSVRHRVI